MSDLERRLAVLETTEEIRAVMLEYCTRVDSLDAVAAAGLFTTDGVLRNATGTFEGRDAIGAYYREAFGRIGPFSRHHLANQVITVESPDRVRHRAHSVACMTRGDASRLVFGRYDDVLVRTAEGWRFQLKVNDTHLATTVDDGWGAAVTATDTTEGNA